MPRQLVERAGKTVRQRRAPWLFATAHAADYTDEPSKLFSTVHGGPPLKQTFTATGFRTKTEASDQERSEE